MSRAVLMTLFMTCADFGNEGGSGGEFSICLPDYFLRSNR
jgi:hypothetical protein